MIVVEREALARMVRGSREQHNPDKSLYDQGFVAAMSLVEAMLALVPAYDLGKLTEKKDEGI